MTAKSEEKTVEEKTRLLAEGEQLDYGSRTLFQRLIDWLPVFSETCERCNGTGSLEGNVDHTHPCSDCGGVGYA